MAGKHQIFLFHWPEYFVNKSGPQRMFADFKENKVSSLKKKKKTGQLNITLWCIICNSQPKGLLNMSEGKGNVLEFYLLWTEKSKR